MATVLAGFVTGQIGIGIDIVRPGDVSVAILAFAFARVKQVVATIEDDPRRIAQVF